MRKKVDSRIRTLVENCVKQRHRSLFVIVGDKGRDQVLSFFKIDRTLFITNAYGVVCQSFSVYWKVFGHASSQRAFCCVYISPLCLY